MEFEDFLAVPFSPVPPSEGEVALHSALSPSLPSFSHFTPNSPPLPIPPSPSSSASSHPRPHHRPSSSTSSSLSISLLSPSSSPRSFLLSPSTHISVESTVTMRPRNKQPQYPRGKGRRLEAVPPLPPQSSPQILAPWRLWENVAIKITNLPLEANSHTIWTAFKNEGKIFSIDLFEDHHGHRTPKGKIRFKLVFLQIRMSHYPNLRPGRRLIPTSGERAPITSRCRTDEKHAYS